MNVGGIVMTDESGRLLSVSVGGGEDLLKAHVKGYSRSDGTYVKDHETSVQAAAEKTSGGDRQKQKQIDVEYPAHVKNAADKYDYLSKIPAEKRTPAQKAAIKAVIRTAMVGKHSPEYAAHKKSARND